MKSDLLHDFLLEVKLEGSAKISKKRIIWLLSRQYEGSGAWTLLLNEWEEIGEARGTLHATCCGEHYTFANGAVAPVTEWV